MNSLTRLVGFSVVLLLVFVVAALAAQGWLHRQTNLLRGEVIETRKAQLVAALQLMPRPVERWDDEYRRALGTLVNGTLTVHPDGAAPPQRPASGPASFYFDQKIGETGAPAIARLTFAAPPMSRLLSAHQRITVGLLLLGGVLVGVGGFLAILSRRHPSSDPGTRSPWQATRAEMGSLEQLAKTSVAQGQALDHERVGRRRAEEDAQLKEGLLNRSIEERVGLGRDLHDGIIQSLYAVGLTLESVRGLVKTNPGEVDSRLQQCTDALNNTIREVRAYITGLAPDHLRRASFTQALGGLLNDLGMSQEINFDIKVDDEAAGLLSAEQVNESLQIAREAVSNALRHGGASSIMLRLHKSDREVCLLVQDNGTGFDASRRREGGHGLGNMEARAARVGAQTVITSRPGEGTRVVITLPLLQSSTL
ncbi:MAG: sensor histidine kinase [Opitutaceae bacterium]